MSSREGFILFSATNLGGKTMDDNYRLDEFTEQVRKIMNRAEAEARRFQHNYIGTEHLLLGLVQEGEGIAPKILTHLGVDLDKVRSSVEFIIGRGDSIVAGSIGLTPRAKRVIELAADEADCLSQHSIGTEHLLLALVHEGEGIAGGVLESLGVNLEKVRIQTLLVLNQSGTPHERDAQPSKTPTIDQVSIDLTAHLGGGTLYPIIGRHQEIERVIQILSRQNKNNPALIGKPGIGKIAIVHGLAQRLSAGEVPETLSGKRLLDVGSLVAGTKSRGEFEERLKKMLEEIRQSRDCIIVIDEVHTLFGATEGAVAATNILKLALARGELQCIGATTLDEYRKYIERDAALQRCFQEVIVHEPDVEETIEVLNGMRESYERCDRLTLTDGALKAAAHMASRYIPDRLMPDKAIDLIDEAVSRVHMQNSPAPLNLQEAKKGLEAILRLKEAAIQQQEKRLAAELCDREVKLRDRIVKLESGWKPIVGEEEITQIVSGIIFKH